MEKKIVQMKPYGWLVTQGKSYPLLNPQPVPQDSCWRSDIYMFFCAVKDQVGKLVGGHVITNNFTVELVANMPSIEINVEEEEKPVEKPIDKNFCLPEWDYNVEFDVITSGEMEEEGFNDPVLDDQYSDAELGDLIAGEE
jgi:hypothetical protein